MNDISQMSHLLCGAHVLGIFLADVFIDCQYALANECLRHCWHVTEIIRYKEHSNDGALRIQQGGLDRSRARD